MYSFRTREPDLDNASVGRVHFDQRIGILAPGAYLGAIFISCSERKGDVLTIEKKVTKHHQ